MVVREDKIDVDEIRAKLTPTTVDDVVGHLEAARLALEPLRANYVEGTSPEILRALSIVQRSLESALDGPSEG
jgi:hypothetical protein